VEELSRGAARPDGGVDLSVGTSRRQGQGAGAARGSGARGERSWGRFGGPPAHLQADDDTRQPASRRPTPARRRGPGGFSRPGGAQSRARQAAETVCHQPRPTPSCPPLARSATLSTALLSLPTSPLPTRRTAHGQVGREQGAAAGAAAAALVRRRYWLLWASLAGRRLRWACAAAGGGWSRLLCRLGRRVDVCCCAPLRCAGPAPEDPRAGASLCMPRLAL
jgi:hypothetical protein